MTLPLSDPFFYCVKFSDDIMQDILQNKIAPEIIKCKVKKTDRHRRDPMCAIYRKQYGRSTEKRGFSSHHHTISALKSKSGLSKKRRKKNGGGRDGERIEI